MIGDHVAIMLRSGGERGPSVILLNVGLNSLELRGDMLPNVMLRTTLTGHQISRVVANSVASVMPCFPIFFLLVARDPSKGNASAVEPLDLDPDAQPYVEHRAVELTTIPPSSIEGVYVISILVFGILQP